MKENIIYKKIICTDFLPKDSLVNNSEIKSHIFLNFIKNNSKEDIINLNYNQHSQWVFEYIHDKFKTYIGNTLGIVNNYAEIHNKNEISIKKNNHNHYDLFNSPDYTAAYVVQGDNSNLIIEWENSKHKNIKESFNIKEKDIIIWNSDLNYYFTENNNEAERIILFFNLIKIKH
jgi:hypothetical protein